MWWLGLTRSPGHAPANDGQVRTNSQERTGAPGQREADKEERPRRGRRNDYAYSFRQLFESAIDSIDDRLLVVDRDFRLVYANGALKSANGDEGVVGRYCYEVTHGMSRPCSTPECACPARAVWATGQAARSLHVHHLDDGTDAYFVVSASPVRDGRRRPVLVLEVMRDVTKRRELERETLEANRRLVALNAVASAVNQSLDLGVVLNSALDSALDVMGAEVGGILLLDEETRTLSYAVHRGVSEQFVLGMARLPLGEGIAGQAALSGQTLVVDDLADDPRVTRRVAVQEGLVAFVSVPLLSKDKVAGVLNIASRKPRSFSEQEVQLLTSLGHQLGTAIEKARLYEELRVRDRARAELLGQLISAQEDERRRLARDLHDVTGQALATIAVRLEALVGPQRLPSELVRERVQEMKGLLASSSQEVHRMIHDLRPSLLDDLGLPAALRSLARGALDPARIGLVLRVEDKENRLDPRTEIALFRIAQEAVSNILAHAHAHRARVSLAFGEERVVLAVEDDGVGFDPSDFARGNGTGSMGLLNMRERAELLGGTVTIETRPGGGTKVTADVPADQK